MKYLILLIFLTLNYCSFSQTYGGTRPTGSDTKKVNYSRGQAIVSKSKQTDTASVNNDSVKATISSNRNDSILYRAPAKYVYCEVVATSVLLSNKVRIQVDKGQEQSWFKSNTLKNSSGDNIQFNSVIDALNYFGDKGWEVIQAYTVTVGNQNVYHYLLKLPLYL